MYQISFYVPLLDAEKVKSAMFKAGAGKHENYTKCSWQTEGKGQFMPILDAKPAIGEIDQIETIHEVRLCALIILVNKYKKEDSDKIYRYYLKHLNSVNNWDLVDTSAPHIVGDYLNKNPEKSKILLEFSRSENLWIRRISIVSTLAFIKNNEFNKTLEIAKLLLNDDHDLIHKAVGWMLREIYKRDEVLIKRFLRQNYAQIPRTTLRYAIERMDKEERLLYLKGNFDVSQR